MTACVTNEQQLPGWAGIVRVKLGAGVSLGHVLPTIGSETESQMVNEALIAHARIGLPTEGSLKLTPAQAASTRLSRNRTRDPGPQHGTKIPDSVS